MKVLFLSSWYPNKFNPTLGNFVEKHAEASSRFNDVYVLSTFSDDSISNNKIEVSEKNGIKSFVVYYPKVQSKIPGWKQFIQVRRRKKALLEAWNEIRKEFQPEIVHLNVTLPIGLFAIYLNKTFGLPFVVTEHSTRFHSIHSEKYNWIEKRMARKVFDRASKILPVSENLGEAIKQIRTKTPVRVISNVVNEKIFSIQNKTTEKSEFLHISTANDAHKNISGILRVIERLKSNYVERFHFTIISDGNIKPHVQTAKSLNLDTSVLTFEGTKTTEEIADYIENSTAFVLFSNYENFPCVIAESFMAGIPVLSTNVNGIPEHVNNKNGILFSPKDENALFEAMEEIILGTKKFDSKEVIRQYALDNFSYDAVGKQFTEEYNEATSNNVQ